MSITSVFDAARDGWWFKNWGKAGFSWDLFHETYLGINPTEDCVRAPLDCAFYEIFKNCGQLGNCGGMSLLALALFKYGGYMGFCGPAPFYSGTVGADSEELQDAIHVLQARQFSAHGIENFIDTVNAGNLNNAAAAMNKVRACLGSGDYAVLCIATDAIGGDAHTVIPYAIEEKPSGYPAGTKALLIWDCNYPYNQYPGYYANQNNRLIIRSAFNWEYLAGAGTGEKVVQYRGSNNGWCFAVPMSVILHKARHPMTLDVVFDALLTAFLSGPGAATVQIEDEQGRRLYTDAGPVRTFETDPNRRLPDCVRWPWYGQNGRGAPPGDLHFLRRRGGVGLTFTVEGADWRLLHTQGGNVIEVEAQSKRRARDTVRVSGFGGPVQTVEVQVGVAKTLHVQQLRMWTRDGGWRAMQVQNARVSDERLTVRSTGDLHALEVSGGRKKVDFDVDLKEYRDESLAARSVGTHTTSAGHMVRLAPEDWMRLEQTDIRTERIRYTR